jgi:hypothetical protein
MFTSVRISSIVTWPPPPQSPTHGVAVEVGVALGDGLGVPVGDALAVVVGVALGALVGVTVGVSVGGTVAVSVAVAVHVGVAVLVGVGVLVGGRGTQSSPPLHTASGTARQPSHVP